MDVMQKALLNYKNNIGNVYVINLIKINQFLKFKSVIILNSSTNLFSFPIFTFYIEKLDCFKRTKYQLMRIIYQFFKILFFMKSIFNDKFEYTN